MKNGSITAITFIILMSFSSTPMSAISSKPSNQTVRNKPSTAHTIKDRQKNKKPEYYRPGQSDGLQNYPGKTIDAGMNTKMLPTNSASHMGNDISF